MLSANWPTYITYVKHLTSLERVWHHSKTLVSLIVGLPLVQWNGWNEVSKTLLVDPKKEAKIMDAMRIEAIVGDINTFGIYVETH